LGHKSFEGPNRSLALVFWTRDIFHNDLRTAAALDAAGGCFRFFLIAGQAQQCVLADFDHFSALIVQANQCGRKAAAALCQCQCGRLGWCNGDNDCTGQSGCAAIVIGYVILVECVKIDP